jgi:hypothetical protein
MAMIAAGPEAGLYHFLITDLAHQRGQCQAAYRLNQQMADVAIMQLARTRLAQCQLALPGFALGAGAAIPGIAGRAFMASPTRQIFSIKGV